MKREFTINTKAGSTAEILVYGTIGDDWDGVSAKTFALQLAAVGDVKQINLRINSPGGSAMDAIAMLAQLARHPAAVDTFVDGWAVSAASVLAMAGRRRVASPQAIVMIHNSWSAAVGDANEMKKMAEILEKTDTQLAAIYANSAGMEEDAVRQLMNAETWYTAAEAQAAGLVTELADDAAALSPAAFVYDRRLLAAVRNVPREVLDRISTSDDTVQADYVRVRQRAIDTALGTL